MGWTKDLADQLGGSEDGIKLILGQLMGYPLVLIHRYFVSDRSSTIQHLYFLLTGLLAAHWVIGNELVHSLYAIVGTYFIIKFAGGSLGSVIASFLFNFGYLMVGYYYTASDGYDICWTMPHCILCLRLIGLTFDLYDGKRGELEGESVLSKDQRKSALVEPPSLLEMLSHSFFIGGYFVGPQFNFRKFKQFASPGFISQLPGSPFSYGFRRLGMSVFYMLIHIVGSMYVPAMWPSSPEWSNTSFIKKMFIMPFWCKFILYKYLSAWLLAEGVCIISGLSFNGLKEDGSVNWKGCANVKLRRFETASRFGHLIESFNINTNDWAAAYVYKRLKFMNNRIISQVSTLFFLALWHGFHTGYFFTFMNEFITMNFEKELMVLLERSERMEKWNQNPVARIVMKAIGWVWVFFFMSQCFIGFSLLTWDRYWPAYKDTYFILHLVYLSWPLWRPPFKSFLKLKPKPEKKE